MVYWASYEETHQTAKKTSLGENDQTDHLPQGADSLSTVLIFLYRSGNVVTYVLSRQTTIGSDNPA